MNAPPQAASRSMGLADDEIDLLLVLQVLWRERLLVLLTTFIPVGLALALYAMQPRVFVADVTFFPLVPAHGLPENQVAAPVPDSVLAELNDPRNYRLPSLVDVLESRDLASRVAERLRLDFAADASVSSRDLADRVKGMVDLAQDPASQALVLQTQAPSPELALKIANAYVESFQEFYGELARGQAARKREWIERRMVDTLGILDADQKRLDAQKPDRASPKEIELLVHEMEMREAIYRQLLSYREAVALTESKDASHFVSVGQAAVLSQPKRSKYFLLIPVAAFVGLMLGLFLAFLRFRLSVPRG